MGQGDLLKTGGKQGRMRANDLPAAQAGGGDDGIRVTSALNGAGERDGGAGGCIALLAVMHFQHFGVMRGGRKLGRENLREREDQIDAGGKISGGKHGDFCCSGADGGMIRLGLAGGAEHPGRAGLRQNRRVRGNRRRDGEIDHDIAPARKGGQIVVAARAADQCCSRRRDRGREQLTHSTADTRDADPGRDHDHGPHSGGHPAFAAPPIIAGKTSNRHDGRVFLNI